MVAQAAAVGAGIFLGLLPLTSPRPSLFSFLLGFPSYEYFFGGTLYIVRLIHYQCK